MNTLPIDANSTKRLDIVDRYFLRRLALAHHKSDKPPVQHMKALMEAILVFVVLPAIAFASLVVSPSLKWTPNTLAKGPVGTPQDTRPSPHRLSFPTLSHRIKISSRRG